MTRVINIKDAPRGWQLDPDYVYIGRAGKGLDGYWGNPVILNEEKDRAEVLRKYISWLRFDTDKFERVGELKGKILVCFCAPKLCHGHILALLADVGVGSDFSEI